MTDDPTPRDDAPPRNPRRVESDARYLQKEARKILRRHAARVAEAVQGDILASVAAIDTARGRGDHVAMDAECERLDVMLQEHASFARKSALRETVENLGLALVVALSVRSCVYEPFKIPSGSMIPTLQIGDHIFVNKFVYGVQVPGTNTVVAEDAVTPVKRGDVVVFRYPLDPAEGDYIKRVIGVGGDTVRVQGREIWIKARGSAEYEPVEQSRDSVPCLDEDGVTEISACERFVERLGDHEYVVRYMNGTSFDMAPIAPKPKTYEVPEDHLFVMGDNRDQSKDSRMWRSPTEAVSADRLVTQQDLRDLGGSDATFVLSRPGGFQGASADEVSYHGSTRAPGYDLSLDVWRSPSSGSINVYEALGGLIAGAQDTTVGALVRGGTDLVGRAKAATLETGAEIDRLVVGGDAKRWEAAWYLQPTDTVFRLSCGRRSCTTSAQLAERIAYTVREFNQDQTQDAKELVSLDRRATFKADWIERDAVAARWFETELRSPSYARDPKGSDVVRLRVWRGRGTGQGKELLRDAALRQAGASRATATSVPELGDDAWTVQRPGGVTVVQVLESAGIVAVLDCGAQRCGTEAEAVKLATTVRERAADASRDRRRMPEMLTESMAPGWTQVTPPLPDKMAWDRASYRASARGPEHAGRVRVERAPSAGLEAALAKIQASMRAPMKVAELGVPAIREQDGSRVAFVVASSQTVVDIECGQGICPDVSVLMELASRARNKASDTTNFVDPNAWRARPYVPRGNVKGRADRIWWPMGRFWTAVR